MEDKCKDVASENIGIPHLTREQELLKSAVTEIIALRQINSQMNGRLKMFDDCMRLFNNYPQGGMAEMSSDVVYSIEKYLMNATSKSTEKEKLSDDRAAVTEGDPLSSKRQ